MSEHPILTKLGIKMQDLCIQPKNMSELDNMIFFKSAGSCGWGVKIIITHEGKETDDFYLWPDSVENVLINDKIVNAKGIVELNTLFDRQMKAGDVVVLDEYLRIV